MLEIFIVYKIRNGLTLEYYFFGIFLSINIILSAISFKSCIKENNIFAVLGRKYSLSVYIIHLGCINISTMLLSRIGIEAEKSWGIFFGVTTLISFGISVITDLVISFVKNINKKR